MGADLAGETAEEFHSHCDGRGEKGDRTGGLRDYAWIGIWVAWSRRTFSESNLFDKDLRFARVGHKSIQLLCLFYFSALRTKDRVIFIVLFHVVLLRYLVLIGPW